MWPARALAGWQQDSTQCATAVLLHANNDACESTSCQSADIAGFTASPGHNEPLCWPLPAVQSVQKAAAGLAPYTDGASADEVAAFLTHLGGIGAGLHEMMQTEDGNVGQIFREYAGSSHKKRRPSRGVKDS